MDMRPNNVSQVIPSVMKKGPVLAVCQNSVELDGLASQVWANMG